MKFRNKKTKIIVNVNNKNEWLISQYEKSQDYEKVVKDNALDKLDKPNK